MMHLDQTNRVRELLIQVDTANPAPLRDQLESALRSAITGGQLPAGGRLPSSRELAQSLHCSRWVITEVYEQLVAEGYLES